MAAGRRYRVTHRTEYRYSAVVTNSYGRGHLTPRDTARQRCLAFDPVKRPARVSEVQGTLDHLADELVKKPEDRLETM